MELPAQSGQSVSKTRASAPQSFLRFGEFEVDLQMVELRRRGIRLKLQEQPLRLLGFLAERAGQVVTREDLQRHLWPDHTFVDFEVGLNTAIRKLREALHDTPARPRFVETVRGHGYRFLPAVERVMPAEAPGVENIAFRPVPALSIHRDSVAPPHPATGLALNKLSSSFWNGPPGLAAAAVCILCLAFAFWWMTPLPPPRVVQTLPITTTGREDYPVRTPTDGARVYYLERAGDHWQTMQTSLDGGQAQPLPVPFRNTRIIDVSPDASRFLIGSFDQRGAEMPLWSIPAQGGSPLRLASIVAGVAVWSHDGRRIAFTHQGKIWIADSDGAHARVAVVPNGNPDWPAWSPDGRRLRYDVSDFVTGATTLWEVAADGGNPHPVLPRWSPPADAFYGSWTPDGRYYIFAAVRNGKSDLWALREKSGSWRRGPSGPFQLTSAPSNALGASISRDGRRVYYYGGAWHEQLQRWPLDTKAMGTEAAKAPEALKVIDSGRYSPYLPALNPGQPAFSADGQWLAYVDSEGLWRSRADGTERRKLTPEGMAVWFPRWSPEGGSIVFSGHSPGGSAMAYRISRDGGAPKPILPGYSDVRDPDASPDGKTVVVSRMIDPAAHRFSHELVLVDTATGSPQIVPGSEEKTAPRWSPNGPFIAAVAEDQHQLFLFDARTRQWTVVAHGSAIGIPAWSADGRYLYFQDLLGPGEPLYRVQVSAAGPPNAPRRVADFSAILQDGVVRCAFMGLTPDSVPLIAFSRSDFDLFAADLDLP